MLSDIFVFKWNNKEYCNETVREYTELALRMLLNGIQIITLSVVFEMSVVYDLMSEDH